MSIASIAESTKILPALLEGLENGDVTRWPTGLYRRSFIRAYASGIGLDAEPLVREFLQHFPDPEDAATALPLPPAPPAPKPTWSALRLTFPDGVPLGPTVLEELRWRIVAVAVDAFCIGVAGVLSYSLLGMLWAPLCIIGALYFFVSVLVTGTTPGVVLFGLQPRGARPAQSPDGVSRLSRWLGQRRSPPAEG